MIQERNQRECGMVKRLQRGLGKLPVILYYPLDHSQKVELIIIRKIFEDDC